MYILICLRKVDTYAHHKKNQQNHETLKTLRLKLSYRQTGKFLLIYYSINFQKCFIKSRIDYFNKILQKLQW